MKIYIATSWKNPHYQYVRNSLIVKGYEVYDFQDPKYQMYWGDIDPNWENWTISEFRESLATSIADESYQADMGGLRDSDVVVLLLPSNRSAHSEAGWHAGRGKPVYILSYEAIKPELMYKMYTGICGNLEELVEAIESSKNSDTHRECPCECHSDPLFLHTHKPPCLGSVCFGRIPKPVDGSS